MKHVLVIDDSREVRDTLAAFLDASGYQATTVADQQQAVQACREHAFDAILCDLVSTPDESLESRSAVPGLRALQALAKRYPQIPIVAISGYLTQPLMDEARSYGARAALAKPFTPSELTAVLEKLW